MRVEDEDPNSDDPSHQISIDTVKLDFTFKNEELIEISKEAQILKQHCELES